MFRQKVSVIAPSSVANLACGFDILGLALDCDFYDKIEAIRTDKKGVLEISNIEVRKEYHKSPKLSKDINKNTAGLAAKLTYEALVKKNPDIAHYGAELKLFKEMPFASGLGSSAASSVAGSFAINALFGGILEKNDLLKFCIDGERVSDGALHADNVGPALLGGIILVSNNSEHSFSPESFAVRSLPVPNDLSLVILYPHFSILTKDARAQIKSKISLKEFVRQSSSLASFVSALYESDYALIGKSMKDFIIEPQRKSLIPCFDDIQRLAFQNLALGSSISGSGPSIFSLFKNKEESKSFEHSLRKFLASVDFSYDLFSCSINTEGAKLINEVI